MVRTAISRGGLAGLGCSALLPLTISFGVKDLTAVSAAMASGVIAFYQLGYGKPAFAVGPLQKAGIACRRSSAAPAFAAAALAILSFVVVRRPAGSRPAPALGREQPARRGGEPG